jgi:hypothetical protein
MTTHAHARALAHDAGDERAQLRLGIAQSLCYHDKRRAFFEAFGKSLEFLALIGSSGAVLALLEVDTKAAALVLCAVAAGSILLNSVLAPAAKLALHTALRNRLLDLQAQLHARDLNTADIHRLMQVRLEIEKDEPPLSRWLNALCQNEALSALGYDERRREAVPWYYRLGYVKLT